jgi:hypothetical protein
MASASRSASRADLATARLFSKRWMISCRDFGGWGRLFLQFG